MNRYLVFLSATVAIGAMVACKGRIESWRNPLLEQQYREAHPAELSRSPNGNWLLKRLKSADVSTPEGLVIVDIDTGSEVDRIQTAGPCLRASWNPTGSQVAYFEHDNSSGERRLHVWSVKSKPVRVVTPRSHAQPYVRWSPDGKSIAYTTERSQLIIAKSAGEAAVVQSDIKVSRFDWSSDSKAIVATAGSKDAATIVTLSAASGAVQSSFRVPLAAITSITCGPSGMIYAAGPREEGAENVLLAFDGKSDSIEIHRQEVSIRNLLTTEKWGAIVWQNGGFWDRQLSILDLSSRQIVTTRASGEIFAQNFSSDGRRLFALRSSPIDYGIVEIERDGSVSSEVGRRVSKEPSLKQSIIAFPWAGQVVQCVVVHHESMPPENVIVYQHIGPEVGMSSDRWAECSVYSRYGVATAHVGFTGEHQDAVLKQISIRLSNRFPSLQRKILYGSSSAAPHVIRVAVKYPDAYRAVLALCIVSPVGARAHDESPTARVHGFHGEMDLVGSPLRGSEFLRSALPAGWPGRRFGEWTEIPGDDHNLHRDASRGRILHVGLREFEMLP